ncbi:hypothetical protein EPO05_05780 [Patescibacteria group bacterium]|nr:MAG: hypothetical protein EPO05_05780 [Patescibacteria group bacterium]
MEMTNIPVNSGERRSVGQISQASSGRFSLHSSSVANLGSGSLATRILDGLITFSLMAIFFGLPIFFLGTTLQGAAFERQIFFYFWVLVALVSWVTKGVIAGEIKIRRTPLDFPIVLFWGVYVLSTIFSVDKWHSFWGSFGDPSRGLLSVTAVGFTYFIIASHFTEARFRKFLGALLVGGGLASLWMLLGVMGVKFLPAKVLALMNVSPLISVSNLGMFLEMLIPLMIVAVFKLHSIDGAKGKANVWRITLTGLLLVFLVLDIFLLFLFFQFTPWIGLAVGFGFLLIYIVSLIVKPERWTWLPMVVFAVVMVLWLGVGPLGTEQFRKIVKVNNLPVELVREQEFSLTWQVAKNSLKGGFGQMVIGSGPANYSHAFALYKPQDFNNNFFYSTRLVRGGSIFLESIATLGVIGAIAFLIMVLSFISVCVYLLSRGRERNRVYSLGLITAAVIVLVNSFLGRAEGPMLLLGALVCALAMIMVLKESGSEEQSINLSLKTSPKFALALGFVVIIVGTGAVLLFIFLGKIMVADSYMGSVAKENQVLNVDSVKRLSKAVSLYKLEGTYFVKIGQEYMILANNERQKGANASIDDIGLFMSEAVRLSEQGVSMMPKDVGAVESLGLVYENAGLNVPNNAATFFDKAEKSYQSALSLEPHNPNFSLKLGQLKVDLALMEKDEAKRKQLIDDSKSLFQAAIKEKNDFAPGYYNLALSQQALGDQDTSITTMGKAASLDKANVTYLFNLGRLLQTRAKGQDLQDAELLYREILRLNPSEVNAHFQLALLYEKLDKKEAAVKEYESVLSLLPADQKDVRTKIEEMIANVKKGVKNIASGDQKLPDQTQATDQSQAPAVNQ